MSAPCEGWASCQTATAVESPVNLNSSERSSRSDALSSLISGWVPPIALTKFGTSQLKHGIELRISVGRAELGSLGTGDSSKSGGSVEHRTLHRRERGHASKCRTATATASQCSEPGRSGFDSAIGFMDVAIPSLSLTSYLSYDSYHMRFCVPVLSRLPFWDSRNDFTPIYSPAVVAPI
jgi:hypothetical protein